MLRRVWPPSAEHVLCARAQRSLLCPHHFAGFSKQSQDLWGQVFHPDLRNRRSERGRKGHRRAGEWAVCAPSHLTAYDPWTVCSPAGCSVHGILQAGILEWVARPSSRGSSWSRDWTHVSRVGRRILYLLSHLGSRVALGSGERGTNYWGYGRLRPIVQHREHSQYFAITVNVK